jgi:hypothetical protein
MMTSSNSMEAVEYDTHTHKVLKLGVPEVDDIADTGADLDELGDADLADELGAPSGADLVELGAPSGADQEPIVENEDTHPGSHSCATTSIATTTRLNT